MFALDRENIFTICKWSLLFLYNQCLDIPMPYIRRICVINMFRPSFFSVNVNWLSVTSLKFVCVSVWVCLWHQFYIYLKSLLVGSALSFVFFFKDIDSKLPLQNGVQVHTCTLRIWGKMCTVTVQMQSHIRPYIRVVPPLGAIVVTFKYLLINRL